MKNVSYSELRQNLARYMERACADNDALLVTRQGAEAVVMLSASEYEGLMETVHLLRSPANAERLLRAIRGAEAGDMVERELLS